MSHSLIVLHGGCWNNSYEGGVRDYIPIAPGGLSYEVFLSKIESRLNKDMATHIFRIDAIVKSHRGETFRMRVTDDFEWKTLMDMTPLPTLYVTASPKSSAGPRSTHRGVSPDSVGYDVASTVRPCKSTSINCTKRWTMAGMDKQAFEEQADVNLARDPSADGEFAIGATFRSKDIMISVIHSFHLKNSLEFRTTRSNLGWYYLMCKHDATCTFSLRCKAVGKSWKITKFAEHTCVKDMRNCSESRVSARAIAEYVLPNMCEDGFSVRPCDICGQVLREFGVRVSYNTALIGRNRALKLLYGDQDKSFQMLPKYLFMLAQSNPGSVVALKTRDDGAFQYCFFCLSASIRAFKACRPVVVIDATHLRGRYKGVLFVACTKDANEQIVLIAFGVGDKEESESWVWFLEHVRKSIGTTEDMLNVSDQHRSIKSAVETVYPGTPHAFCTFHIQGNLKTCRGWKGGAVDMFHSAAKAYTEDDFIEHMQNLEAASPSAHCELMAIGPNRWASCRCPVRRYAFGTSNSVESLNSRLKWGRKLPITSLLEYARNIVQLWFYKRRTIECGRGEEVSEYAEKRLDLSKNKANSYRVAPISHFKFNVTSGTKSNKVDLHKGECSCRIFQTDQLPCSHAVAALRYKNESPIAHVNAYYSTNAWQETYAEEVIPVPDPTTWRTPPEIEAWFVGTPVNPKQAGRPKTKRIPSGYRASGQRKVVESTECKNEGAQTSERPKKPLKCARCHKRGHYVSTCNAFVEVTHGVGTDSAPPTPKRKRAPKRCSSCGSAGHTRTTCKALE